MDCRQGETKHIAQDKAGFMELHRYLVGSRTVILGNNGEEDVFGVETYHLNLNGGSRLLLHDAPYTPGVQCFFVSSVSIIRLGFTFGFCLDCLDLFYKDNLFGQATLKREFIVLDLDDSHDSISSAFIAYFDSDFKSIKWHARHGHTGQDK